MPPQFTIGLCALAVGAVACVGKAGMEVHPGQPQVTAEAPNWNPALPFEAASPESALSKVKNLLTGLPPTTAERDAFVADPASLKGMIDGWMALPAAQQKFLSFFGNAFQQKEFVIADLLEQVGGQVPSTAAYNTNLLANAKESFARTALQLVEEGKSFQETLTTQRYMVTPALLSLLAFIDNVLTGDDNRFRDRLYAANNTFSFSVQNAEGPIPLQETLNPSSTRYMKWYSTKPFPNNCTVTTRLFSNNVRTPTWLFQMLFGTIRQDLVDTGCTGFNGDPQFLPDDFNQWRMVTIRPPRAGEQATPFYDLLRLRSSSEIILNTARIGFFTTPAFFANWITNTSNQSRVTMNQTLIVALGKSFDPSDTTVPVSESGMDSDKDHANPTTACYACHRTLDPMRQFFRKSYSLSYHQQQNTTQLAVQPQFAVDGVSASGNTLEDLAQMLASHPRFATAWTQKLCHYANSAGCSDDDPEFLRVADAFGRSGFNFKVLVRELFSSPLVTGLKATKTFDDRGMVISIARLDHLCTSLTQRLGITNACNASTKARRLATNIPSDSYSRGADKPVLNSDTSLFYRAATENLCLALADLAVDTAGSRYQSTQKDAAIDDFVATVMALPAGDPRAEGAGQILTEHYAGALKTGVTAKDALKSTFTLACSSPTAVAVGL